MVLNNLSLKLYNIITYYKKNRYKENDKQLEIPWKEIYVEINKTREKVVHESTL